LASEKAFTGTKTACDPSRSDAVEA
jgi:hypothetical protein